MSANFSTAGQWNDRFPGHCTSFTGVMELLSIYLRLSELPGNLVCLKLTVPFHSGLEFRNAEFSSPVLPAGPGLGTGLLAQAE